MHKAKTVAPHYMIERSHQLGTLFLVDMGIYFSIIDERGHIPGCSKNYLKQQT